MAAWRALKSATLPRSSRLSSAVCNLEMSMFPRTPVASLVCPSAPFLAPRLLRASVPRTALSAPCSTPQRPTYATEARGKDKGRALLKTYRGKAQGESKRGPLARGSDSKPTEADKSRRISHGRAVVRTYVGQERRKLSQPEDEVGSVPLLRRASSQD